MTAGRYEVVLGGGRTEEMKELMYLGSVIHAWRDGRRNKWKLRKVGCYRRTFKGYEKEECAHGDGEWVEK